MAPTYNVTSRDYVLGMVALTSAKLPFGHHVVQVSAYTIDDALYSAIVRVMGNYSDPEGLLLRTVFIAAATPESVVEAAQVAKDAFLRDLPLLSVAPS
jgi:hypothetical protein